MQDSIRYGERGGSGDYGGNGTHYTYNWNTGEYNDPMGRVVGFGETFNNSITPNSSYSFNSTTFGWDHLYLKYSNNTPVIVGSVGGEITGIKDGMIQATNNAIVGQLNLSLYLLAESGAWKNGNGEGINLSVAGYAATDIGLLKGTADCIAAGEFKSATSWSGWNKLLTNQQAWRSAKVFGSSFSKGLIIAGHVGTVLGAVSAGYSTDKAITQFNKGGIEAVDGLVASDAIVGWLGTASTVALAFGASNPIGWAVLGAGATAYGVVRLGMFIYNGE